MQRGKTWFPDLPKEGIACGACAELTSKLGRGPKRVETLRQTRSGFTLEKHHFHSVLTHTRTMADHEGVPDPNGVPEMSEDAVENTQTEVVSDPPQPADDPATNGDHLQQEEEEEEEEDTDRPVVELFVKVCTALINT